MMHSVYLILILLICSISGYSEDVPALTQLRCSSLKNAGDCSSAIEVKLFNTIRFECTPEGYGKKLEIQGNSSKSKYFFQKEHNTVWLKFDISIRGLLTFQIIPRDTSYDYDFLIFKEKGKDFCKGLMERATLPVRSNLSRNNTAKRSITGLSLTAGEPFVQAGVESVFSSALKVEKGDRFYLVIDNVYGGSKGFSLKFKYFQIIPLAGKVTDKESGENLKAEITWEDAATGVLMARTESNHATGEYKMDVPVDAQRNSAEYTLTAYGDHYFFN